MPRIYSIHDSKSEAYLQPFFMRTKAEAIRSFQSATKDTTSPFSQYPADFTLYELGEFDELSSSIVTHAKPVHLANAAEFTNQI